MLEQCPTRRTAGITSRIADGEAVVYDADTGAIHLLSRELTRVWSACQPGRSFGWLAETSELPLDAVRALVAELDELGLLTAAAPGLDRRSFLQRGALIGAGVLAVPAAATIFAPAAFAATSNIVDGGKAVANGTYMMSILGAGGGTGQASFVGTAGGAGGVGALVTGIFTAPSAGTFSIYVGNAGGTGTAAGTPGASSVENGSSSQVTGGAGGPGTTIIVVTQGGGGAGGGASAVLFTPTGSTTPVTVAAAGAGGGGNGGGNGVAKTGGNGSLTSIATAPTGVTVATAGGTGGGGGGGGATGGTGGSTGNPAVAATGGTTYFPGGFKAVAGTNAGAAGSVAIVHTNA